MTTIIGRTEKGETDDYTASDHLRAILDHAAPGIVEYCIVNTARVPAEVLERYKSEEAYPVIPDTENIKKMKCRVIEAHIINIRDYIRNDSAKVARLIIDLVASLKKSKG